MGKAVILGGEIIVMAEVAGEGDGWLLGGTAGDDVDYSAQGVVAVADRTAAADDLDFFDIVQGQGAPVDIVTAHHPGRVDAAAVDVEHDPVAGKATNGHGIGGIAHRGPAAAGDVRLIADGVGDVEVGGALNAFAPDFQGCRRIGGRSGYQNLFQNQVAGAGSQAYSRPGQENARPSGQYHEFA